MKYGKNASTFAGSVGCLSPGTATTNSTTLFHGGLEGVREMIEEETSRLVTAGVIGIREAGEFSGGRGEARLKGLRC